MTPDTNISEAARFSSEPVGEDEKPLDTERRPPIQAAPATPDPAALKIAYVGGGSRMWAPMLMQQLVLTPDLSGTVALHDVDQASAERNERLGAVINDHEDAVSEWTFRAEPDRSAALQDADFVMLSTQFPIPEAHVPDLEIPREHGVYQPVGVTIGPAGVSWNMRSIPLYRDIAASIREHCPDAWVLNYTNPLTHLTRTLYREFPDINAIGLCHGVRHAKEHLAGLVGRYVEASPTADDITANVLGVNHFTWMDTIQWRGHDLFELLDYHLDQPGVRRQYTTAELEEGTDVAGVDDRHQVAYELYERFGVFPAISDRHLVEYAPWFLTGEMPADLHRWGVERTTVEERMEHWEDRPEKIEAWINGEAELDLAATDEEMVDVMRALLGEGPVRLSVNLPNRGQMVDLPEDAVVETTGVVESNRVTPHVAGRLPTPVQSQVRTHLDNQETLVEAAFTGDVDLAFQAFLNDPQITMQVDRAADLFADLVGTHADHLDDWALEESSVLADSDTWPP